MELDKIVQFISKRFTSEFEQLYNNTSTIHSQLTEKWDDIMQYLDIKIEEIETKDTEWNGDEALELSVYYFLTAYMYKLEPVTVESENGDGNE